MLKLRDKPLLCEISCVIPLTKSQISRSAPPLQHTSTRNDVFLITLYAATY